MWLSEFILGCELSEIRERVVLAPCWLPESVGIDCSRIVSRGNVGIWDCSFEERNRFSYIVPGVGAGVCSDVVMALSNTVCKELLFIGSAGAFGSTSRIGDMAIAERSICAEGATRFHSSDVKADTFGQTVYSDESLLRRMAPVVEESAKIAGVSCHSGSAVSVESLYSQEKWLPLFQSWGCMFVDMESSAVLASARQVGIRAAALFCISDCPISGKSLARVEESDFAFRRTMRLKIFPEILRSFAV